MTVQVLPPENPVGTCLARILEVRNIKLQWSVTLDGDSPPGTSGCGNRSNQLGSMNADSRVGDIHEFRARPGMAVVSRGCSSEVADRGSCARGLSGRPSSCPCRFGFHAR